ncbi:efflux transporter outer membrane subunit [Pseudomonas sp. App30]|uniref:efflux transporter outer membrane subunit n=1 Tax=Pseudomonas sp. App30 TaxID=3068990 RepID=UPI003A80D245
MYKSGSFPATVLVGLAIVGLLGACAPMPTLPQPTAAKQLSSYATTHSFEPLAHADSQWPREKWWYRYNDAQLNALIDEGLKGDPTLAQAQARLLRAQGSEQQTNASLLPGLNAQASVERKKQSYNNGVPAEFVPQGMNTYGSAEFDFSYELDFWGRNHAALAAATSEYEAAQADIAQARMVLATSLAEAYADLARLYAERDADEAAMKVRVETAQLFAERFNQGLETQSSVHQAQSRASTAQATWLETDESIALCRNRLAALLGAGPDRGLSIARPSIDFAKSTGLPDSIALGLLGRRPDVVIARLRAEAAAARINESRAQFYPNINLSAMVGVQSLGLNMLGKSGSDVGNIGPAISLPIFNGGRLRGQLRSARGTYDEAVANYDETLTKALHDVADTIASERALGPRLDATKASYDAAAQARQVTENRYRGGLDRYLDVLNAEDTMIAAQRKLADIKARRFALDVSLVKALGGGYISVPTAGAVEPPSAEPPTSTISQHS